MGVTSASPNDEAEQEPPSSDAVTQRFVAPAVGERCVTCDAPLASDQRYCLNCGERRGRSRFSEMTGGSATVTETVAASAAPAERPRRRLSSGATLVAGIATLLLAMGVGVEIGQVDNHGQQRAASPGVQVVTVAGSGGGAAASTAGNTGGATSPKSHAKTKAAASATPKVVHITQKVQAQAASAAKKVLGSSSANLAPPTVQPGQSCTHGAGCQNGHFTGNFFGP